MSETSSVAQHEKVVLILVGLIGSGKSTFASALEKHFPNFRRCNQDDLGNRQRVEQLARESMLQGLSVCIDRTNFDAVQRQHWIRLARDCPGTLIWVIVFDTPYDVCVSRLHERTSHPTIHSPEQGLSVLSRFASDFKPPLPEEGYDRLISLQPSEHPSPSYTYSDVATILQQIRDSPANTTPWNPRTWTAASPRRSHTHRGFQPYRGRFNSSVSRYSDSNNKDLPPSI